MDPEWQRRAFGTDIIFEDYTVDIDACKTDIKIDSTPNKIVVL